MMSRELNTVGVVLSVMSVCVRFDQLLVLVLTNSTSTQLTPFRSTRVYSIPINLVVNSRAE